MLLLNCICSAALPMRGDDAVTDDDDDDDMQEMHCATSTPAVTSPCALAAAAVWERGEESMYVRAQNACACVSAAAAAAAEHELANRHTHTDTHMHTSLFLSVCLAMAVLCCAAAVDVGWRRRVVARKNIFNEPTESTACNSSNQFELKREAVNMF